MSVHARRSSDRSMTLRSSLTKWPLPTSPLQQGRRVDERAMAASSVRNNLVGQAPYWGRSNPCRRPSGPWRITHVHHAGLLPVLIVPAGEPCGCGAADENRCNNNDSSRDNPDPRQGLAEPGPRLRGRGRFRSDRHRFVCGFGCFTHWQSRLGTRSRVSAAHLPSCSTACGGRR
jgi:hypothetical protein